MRNSNVIQSKLRVFIARTRHVSTRVIALFPFSLVPQRCFPLSGISDIDTGRMDDSSAVDVSRNVPNALLTSVLGLKGPLRITPHGSEHKPHIILKRVDTPNNLESNGESNCVARFSFFAHKRFEVKPGKEIMFTVASADGSEGPFKEVALVLEADIDTTLDTTDEDETNHSPAKKVDVTAIGNVQGLPPKMRKSYTKEKTYASFISSETLRFSLILPRPPNNLTYIYALFQKNPALLLVFLDTQ